MEDWLLEQARSVGADWEDVVDRFYPDEARTWNEPEAQLDALTNRWNALAAVDCIDWNQLLSRSNLRVLDLGAGTGWLSGYLSRFTQIADIDALDSSMRNLETMLPRVVELMGGIPEKIRPIHGLFSPLLVPAGHYDLIVASSAIHHAPRLSVALDECHRVLADNGVMVLLNETPLTTVSSLYKIGRMTVRICLRVLRGRYEPFAPYVSAGGLLYDPYLGDLAYSMAQWDSAFALTGWDRQVVRTTLGSYKTSSSREPRLTHFLLRKGRPHPPSLGGGRHL